MAESASGEKKNVVMIAIDEGESSEYALHWALENIRETIGSKIILFKAEPVSGLSYVPAASFGAAPPELIASMQDHQKKASLALLEHAKGICSEKGVDAEIITEVGDPKDVICEAVDKHKVNLLIMGSHGRGALQRVFLGSVSNYCVHNAKCPVLVVKKQG